MARLNLVAWHCYTGNDDDNVLAALSTWAARYAYEPLHVFALSEAASHHDALAEWCNAHDWRLLQEKPERGRPRGDDTGDVAILLAPGVRLRVHWRARMRQAWMVVRYRRVHEPHVYEVAGISIPRKRRWLPGRRWRIEAAHWPTGGVNGRNREAWLESARHARAWLARGRVPSIVVGDLNEQADTLADWYGPRFKVFGKRIDVAVTRGVTDCRWTELGKGGGDHHGRFYRFTA